MDQHATDQKRLMTRDQLEKGQSPDPLWNAAQWELVFLGKMHGYLRMYWAKQILLWMSPREAVETAIYLNDTYSIDGRDPNGHLGVLWCYGMQDRPFSPARPIFGTIRPMTYSGACGKFDTKGYIERIKKECVRLALLHPVLLDRTPKQDIRLSMMAKTQVSRSSSSSSGSSAIKRKAVEQEEETVGGTAREEDKEKEYKGDEVTIDTAATIKKGKKTLTDFFTRRVV